MRSLPPQEPSVRLNRSRAWPQTAQRLCNRIDHAAASRRGIFIERRHGGDTTYRLLTFPAPFAFIFATRPTSTGALVVPRRRRAPAVLVTIGVGV